MSKGKEDIEIKEMLGDEDDYREDIMCSPYFSFLKPSFQDFLIDKYIGREIWKKYNRIGTRYILMKNGLEEYRKAILIKYGSYQNYQEYRAKERGFVSYKEYLNFLAVEKGFKNYTEYQNWRHFIILFGDVSIEEFRRRYNIKNFFKVIDKVSNKQQINIRKKIYWKNWLERNEITYLEYMLNTLQKRGFNSHYEYNLWRIQKKGFNSDNEYLIMLAKRKGFKTRGEKQLADAKKRGFKKWQDLLNHRARKRGFKGAVEYKRWLYHKNKMKVHSDDCKFCKEIKERCDV